MLLPLFFSTRTALHVFFQLPASRRMSKFFECLNLDLRILSLVRLKYLRPLPRCARCSRRCEPHADDFFLRSVSEDRPVRSGMRPHCSRGLERDAAFSSMITSFNSFSSERIGVSSETGSWIARRISFTLTTDSPMSFATSSAEGSRPFSRMNLA